MKTFDLDGETYPVTEDVILFTSRILEQARESVESVEIVGEEKVKLHFNYGGESIEDVHGLVQSSIDNKFTHDAVAVREMVDDLGLEPVD